MNESSEIDLCCHGNCTRASDCPRYRKCEPIEHPELDSPWWLAAAAIVVVLTCAASAIWPMGWAT